MSKPSGWLHQQEQSELEQLARGRRCIEIGAWEGLSTTIIAAAALELTTCDWWQGDEFTEAVAGPVVADDMLLKWRRNVAAAGVADKIKAAVVGDMRRTLPMIDAAQFDFVFYDADHAGEPTQFALDWAWAGAKRREKRGQNWAFALHDYKPRNPKYGDANAAIDAFSSQTGIVMRRVGSLAIFEG